MPKRPCAITFTTDDSEILSADKFGDVYSLPLLPTPEQEETFAASLKPATPKAFAPSATEQTVHSKANRRALEAQLKQAKDKQSVKTKEPLAFAHQLLLGHVSMLTDLVITTIIHEEAAERPRTYLLTSDRDEHIRISRGPPQAFVIEGYCLGHHEFVNRLCLAEPGLLVSGGGDDDLLVWDWLHTKLVNKVNISKAVHRVKENLHRQEEGQEEEGNKDVQEDTRVAVSGLWRLMSPSMGKVSKPTTTLHDEQANQNKSHLLIACEGVPALFHFPVLSLRHESGGEDIGYIPLIGNPLAITIVNNIIIVSTDTIHEPGSTTDVDSSEVRDQKHYPQLFANTLQNYKPRLHAFELVGEDLDGGGVWKGHVGLNQLLVDLNEQSTVEWHEKALQALLYGVENLRKRSGERDDQEN
jgi:tRNA (guanine-N(7)-)-methyltransferase subunit TRM82